MMRESSKAMRTAAWALSIPMTLFLFLAGGTKILGLNPLASIEPMAPWVFWIGLGEFSAALLFLIPRTSILGAFALSAHLGGAILFHIIRGESFFNPSIFISFWFQSAMLFCVWLVVVLRCPGVLTNFK